MLHCHCEERPRDDAISSEMSPRRPEVPSPRVEPAARNDNGRLAGGGRPPDFYKAPRIGDLLGR